MFNLHHLFFVMMVKSLKKFLLHNLRLLLHPCYWLALSVHDSDIKSLKLLKIYMMNMTLE